MTVALYTEAADFIKKIIARLIRRVETSIFKRNTVTHVTCKTLVILVILNMTTLFTVTVITAQSNLNFVDSLYFWFQTLTTIGYGDVYPEHKHSFADVMMKLILIFGMGITASIISSVACLIDEVNGRKLKTALSSRREYDFENHLNNKRTTHVFKEEIVFGL